MYSKYAIRQFLQRPLDDLSKWKTRPLEELRPLFDRVGYYFITEPRPYQIVPILLGMKYRNLLLYIGMGGGKTKIISDIFRYRQQTGKCRRMLFVVDTVNAMFSIPRTLFSHYDGEVYVHEGSTAEFQEATLDSNADIVVVPYAQLPHIFLQSKSRGKMVPDLPAIQQYAANFDMLVFDEIHRLRNWNTLWYTICANLSEVIPYRYGLTGTPTDRHMMGFWAIHYAVDRGSSFGENFKFFREVFFSERDGRYYFKRGLLRHFRRMVRHRSIIYQDDEIAQALPKLVLIRKYVALDADVRELYMAELARYRREHGDSLSPKVLDDFVKLRQLASGFMYNEDGVVVRMSYNPKLPVLLDLLRRVPEDRKCVIFYEFQASRPMIEQALKDAGYDRWLIIAGDVARSKRESLEREFFDPNGPRFCIVQFQAGSTSVNLQAASVALFYETPVSYITRAQCLKRVHRDGQTKTTYVVDLVVKNGIEERILAYHAQGAETASEVLDEW